MFFFELHLSPLPLCVHVLSHPILLPVIFAVKCHLCNVVVSQEDSADPPKVMNYTSQFR